MIASAASAQTITRAAVALPDNALGHAANAWLDAVNSGDSLQITAFVTDTTMLRTFPSAGPTAARVSAMLGFHRSKGELVPVEVKSDIGDRLTVWVAESGTGAETLFMFTTEPVEPHRLEFVFSVGRAF
jgi:hypothetical protein